MNFKSARIKGDLALLLAAAIWGSGFVAQRIAAGHLNAFYFNGGRFLLGALLLMPLTGFKFKVERKQVPWVLLAGVLLYAASALQQAGMATTTVGNASFITGLYVILVPVIVFLIWKKPVHWFSWVAALLAAVGVGLLSLQAEFHLAPGDTLELAGAFVWAFHVILVGKLMNQGVDVLGFTTLQFAACGVLGMASGLVVDPAGLSAFGVTWQAVLYSAVLPVGLGFTLQAAGQKGAPPVDAALILSMEAVFGVLFAFLFLQELLSPRQIAGCALILAAMLLAQIKPQKVQEIETTVV